MCYAEVTPAFLSPLRTLISAELDIGKQSDLDDLPQEAQYQVRLSRFQVEGTDIHYMAADGRRRVQGQVQVLLQGTKQESGGTVQNKYAALQ